MTRRCSPADIAPTSFVARCVARICSSAAKAPCRMAWVTTWFGQSADAPKKPAITASSPQVPGVRSPGSSAPTTPNSERNCDRSHRSRPSRVHRMGGTPVDGTIGYSSRVSVLISVDLPQPFGPSNTMCSPSAISIEIPCRASVSPRATVTLRMERKLPRTPASSSAFSVALGMLHGRRRFGYRYPPRVIQ